MPKCFTVFQGGVHFPKSRISAHERVEWWLRPESNRHFPEGNTILNRARLPIPPLSLQIEILA